MTKMKHKKKKKISLTKIIAILLLILSIALTTEIFLIDIVPFKYFVIYIVIVSLINLVTLTVTFRKSQKKKLKRTVTGFAVFFILLFGAIFVYLLQTSGFLDSIKESEYKVENYSVIVKKSSAYKKLSDIKGLSVGYYSKTTGAKKANKKLNSKVDVTFAAYDDSIAMAKELLGQAEEETDNSTEIEESKEQKDLEVIVVEDSILSMIEEEITNFKEDTRVIYKFKIKIKATTSKKDVDVTSKSFNIYISGIDTFGEISSVSRSDVNMVVTVNPKTKQILLTSIPRDYYVKLHTYKAYDKLTHAGMYGVEESIQTIEDLLDIDINYYVKVNFTSVVDVVNALGGLKVYSDYNFTSEDGFTYSEGYNNMNGEEALSFARERHSFSDGDRQRVKDQQAVLAALIKKICSKSILTKYSSILNSLEGEFDTNMSTRKVKSLVKMQLNDMATWTVTSISLNGHDSHDVTYSAGSQVLYVMEPDESTVSESSELIKKVMKGKKLKGTYTFSGKGSSVTKKKKTTVNPTTKTEMKTNQSTNTSSVSANVSCSSGYTLSKDKTVCTKVETVGPTYACSSGQLSDGYCIVVVGAPTCDLDDAVPCECDEGELSNNQCVKKIAASATCSAGYNLNNNKCTKVTSLTPSYSCPDGYRLSGKVCIK